jgi:hypothetical protein
MSELLAHAFGDYVVQSDWMAAEKTQRHLPALAHAASYAACFFPLTRSPKALLVIGGTHYVIDHWRLAKYVNWTKNQVAPKEARPPMTATGYSPEKPDWMAVWLLIITDNTMHLSINRWALRRWGR